MQSNDNYCISVRCIVKKLFKIEETREKNQYIENFQKPPISGVKHVIHMPHIIICEKNRFKIFWKNRYRSFPVFVSLFPICALFAFLYPFFRFCIPFPVFVYLFFPPFKDEWYKKKSCLRQKKIVFSYFTKGGSFEKTPTFFWFSKKK